MMSTRSASNSNNLNSWNSNENTKRRKKCYFSSPEESVEFMTIFQKYNVLYSKGDHNESEVDNAWSCISNEMDIPINALKTRWKCILDTYNRIKEKKTPSSWYMLDYLKFMENPPENENDNENDEDQMNGDNMIDDCNDDSEEMNEEWLGPTTQLLDIDANTSESTHISAEVKNVVSPPPKTEIKQLPKKALEPVPFRVSIPISSTAANISPRKRPFFSPVKNMPRNSTEGTQTNMLPTRTITLKSNKLTPVNRSVLQHGTMSLKNQKESQSNGLKVPLNASALNTPVKLEKNDSVTSVLRRNSSANVVDQMTETQNDSCEISTQTAAETVAAIAVNSSQINTNHTSLPTVLSPDRKQFDETEIAYGYHVAHQLRRFPEFEREQLRNKIDNLIYQTFLQINGR